jgi:hypothetical protein
MLLNKPKIEKSRSYVWVQWMKRQTCCAVQNTDIHPAIKHTTLHYIYAFYFKAWKDKNPHIFKFWLTPPTRTNQKVHLAFPF